MHAQLRPAEGLLMRIFCHFNLNAMTVNVKTVNDVQIACDTSKQGSGFHVDRKFATTYLLPERGRRPAWGCVKAVGNIKTRPHLGCTCVCKILQVMAMHIVHQSTRGSDGSDDVFSLECLTAQSQAITRLKYQRQRRTARACRRNAVSPPDCTSLR